jgi:energy-coupling factor transport system substrate-specific component
MRELINCWQQTRMIVLIGFCAAIYTAVLLAFKWLPIVPGITEIRPAAALPVVFSIFFGPAAAWGSAFGNVIGDLLGGTIGPGSLFGIPANFIYGYAPYRIVGIFAEAGENPLRNKRWFLYVFLIVICSSLCAFTIALGLEFLNLVPFEILGHAIFLNNFLMSLLLGPLLLSGLEKRIHQMHLGYTQILEPNQFSRPLFGRTGPFIVLALLIITYTVSMNPTLIAGVVNAKLFAIAASILLPVAALIFL